MQWQLLLLLFRDFKQRQAVVVKQSRWWWCVLGEFGKGGCQGVFCQGSRGQVGGVHSSPGVHSCGRTLMQMINTVPHTCTGQCVPSARAQRWPSLGRQSSRGGFVPTKYISSPIPSIEWYQFVTVFFFTARNCYNITYYMYMVPVDTPATTLPHLPFHIQPQSLEKIY